MVDETGALILAAIFTSLHLVPVYHGILLRYTATVYRSLPALPVPVSSLCPPPTHSLE